MRRPLKILVAAVIASGTPGLVASASAAPLSDALALKNAQAVAPIENVQWRRGGYWRGGRWIGPGIGFGTGLIVGGALAGAPWGYDYGYGPGYYGYGSAYPGYDSYGYNDSDDYWAPGSGQGDDVAYCQQRFRSYDPASGTYLGYDGQLHPCP
jgi:hypothetical protein